MKKNRMLTMVFFIAVLMVCLVAADVGDAAPKVNFGGYIQNTTAMRLHDDNEILWSENIFQMDLDVKLIPGKLFFYFSGKLYYDAVYDMHEYGFLGEHADRKKLRDNIGGPQHDSMAEYIRECYMDIYLGAFDIRIGKQQIVWGETDLFKMLDIINPEDIRHFNQEMWEDNRITLWSVKIDWYLTPNSSLQLVLVPDIEPMFLAPIGSSHPFVPLSQRKENLPPFPMVWHEVGKSLSNMEWGLRWFQTFGAFNYSLNYFYHWGDTPWMNLDLSNLRVDFTYKRMHSLGGSFCWNFTKFLGLKSVVMRFETVVNLETPQFGIDYGNLGLPVTAQSDNFKYCLAFDKTFWKPHFLWPSGLAASFQIFQTYILDYEGSKRKVHYIVGQTNAHEDEVDTLLIAIFSSAYMPGEYLKPQIAMVWHDDGDWEIIPAVTYEVSENVTVNLKATIFTGPRKSLIGEFQDSSNIWLRIKWGF